MTYTPVWFPSMNSWLPYRERFSTMTFTAAPASTQWFGTTAPRPRPDVLAPGLSQRVAYQPRPPGFLDSTWHTINSGPITLHDVGCWPHVTGLLFFFLIHFFPPCAGQWGVTG